MPDAAEAGRLLLLILDPGGTPVIVDVEPETSGLGVTAQPVLDTTRRLALVTADGVEVPAASVRRFAGDPAAAVRRLLDRAAVGSRHDTADRGFRSPRPWATSITIAWRLPECEGSRPLSAGCHGQHSRPGRMR